MSELSGSPDHAHDSLTEDYPSDATNAPLSKAPDGEQQTTAALTALECVTAEEFLGSWQRRGAGTSWGHLKSLTGKNPDFPLQIAADDPRRLIGNISAALTWLEENRKDAKASAVYMILERIKTQRSSGQPDV